MRSASRWRFRPFLIAIAAIGTLAMIAVPVQAKKPVVPPKQKVAVYPSPGTPVASDSTTISFRGLAPKRLGKIKVVGAKSGLHKGRLLVHSDKRGVSFVPKKKFARGERVKVTTNLRIFNAKKGDYRFRIGKFYGNDDRQAGPGKPPVTDGLHSRPDLKPPLLTVETATQEAAPGKVFIAPKQDGLMIVDNLGRTNWFRSSGYGGSGQTVMNFQTQTYKGKPVLTYWKGASTATGFSQIGSYEILNEKYNKIATVMPGNGYKADIHEFALTDRNTALTLSYRGVRWNLSKVGGKTNKAFDNVIQEVDIKTGAVLFEWHSLGNVALGTSAGEPPTDGTAYDYFHANSIKVDGNSYLVSGRRSSSVFRIDQKTGKIRWQLRGDGRNGSSFKMGEGTSFAYQHDAERLPNGDISLFDNGSGRGVPTVNEQSSGVIIRLSGKRPNMKATLVKRFNHPTPVVAASQGNTDVQANGNAMVGWGSVPRATEFNAAGDVVLDITFNEAGDSSYRAFKSDWAGIPKGHPAIASQATTDGATVWASWNGATNIAQWKVLSGPDANSLNEIASGPWANLETEITAPGAGAVVQVQAIDGAGKVIGESAVAPVGTQAE